MPCKSKACQPCSGSAGNQNSWCSKCSNPGILAVFSSCSSIASQYRTCPYHSKCHSADVKQPSKRSPSKTRSPSLSSNLRNGGLHLIMTSHSEPSSLILIQSAQVGLKVTSNRSKPHVLRLQTCSHREQIDMHVEAPCYGSWKTNFCQLTIVRKL